MPQITFRKTLLLCIPLLLVMGNSSAAPKPPILFGTPSTVENDTQRIVGGGQASLGFTADEFLRASRLAKSHPVESGFQQIKSYIDNSVVDLNNDANNPRSSKFTFHTNVILACIFLYELTGEEAYKTAALRLHGPHPKQIHFNASTGTLRKHAVATIDGVDAHRNYFGPLMTNASYIKNHFPNEYRGVVSGATGNDPETGRPWQSPQAADQALVVAGLAEHGRPAHPWNGIDGAFYSNADSDVWAYGLDMFGAMSYVADNATDAAHAADLAQIIAKDFFADFANKFLWKNHWPEGTQYNHSVFPRYYEGVINHIERVGADAPGVAGLIQNGEGVALGWLHRLLPDLSKGEVLYRDNDAAGKLHFDDDTGYKSYVLSSIHRFLRKINSTMVDEYNWLWTHPTFLRSRGGLDKGFRQLLAYDPTGLTTPLDKAGLKTQLIDDARWTQMVFARSNWSEQATSSIWNNMTFAVDHDPYYGGQLGYSLHKNSVPITMQPGRYQPGPEAELNGIYVEHAYKMGLNVRGEWKSRNPISDDNFIDDPRMRTKKFQKAPSLLAAGQNRDWNFINGEAAGPWHMSSNGGNEIASLSTQGIIESFDEGYSLIYHHLTTNPATTSDGISGTRNVRATIRMMSDPGAPNSSGYYVATHDNQTAWFKELLGRPTSIYNEKAGLTVSKAFPELHHRWQLRAQEAVQDFESIFIILYSDSIVPPVQKSVSASNFTGVQLDTTVHLFHKQDTLREAAFSYTTVDDPSTLQHRIVGLDKSQQWSASRSGNTVTISPSAGSSNGSLNIEAGEL